MQQDEAAKAQECRGGRGLPDVSSGEVWVAAQALILICHGQTSYQRRNYGDSIGSFLKGY